MSRPCRRRRIRGRPNCHYFKPQGVPMRLINESRLSLAEFEAIRLVDYLQVSQEQACVQMDISQPTLSRILKNARSKISNAIINGEAISIEKTDNK